MTEKEAPPATLETIKSIVGGKHGGQASSDPAKSREDVSAPSSGPEEKPKPPESSKSSKAKSVSRDDSDADDTSEKQVPPERFNKVYAKLKAEQAKRTELEAELATLRKAGGDMEEQKLLAELEAKKPDGFAEWDTDRQQAWISKHTAEAVNKGLFAGILPDLKTAATQVRVQKSLGVALTPEQADVFAAVLDDAPDLELDETMMLAQHRHPDVFATGSKKPPASHSVQVPATRGGKSDAAPRDDRGRFSKQLLSGTPGSMKSLAVGAIAEMLSKKK